MFSFLPLVGHKILEPASSFDSEATYYLGINEGRMEEYKRHFSETLRRDPKARLKFEQEAKEYLEKQNKEHSEELRGIIEQLGEMDSNCKLSICIPVAGHQEGQHIYKALGGYSRQTAKKSDYEIVLFINHPDNKKPDNTIEEIERFRLDHPEINVRVAYQTFPADKVKMGHIRKLLDDAVIQRSLDSGKRDKEIILVSNDADNSGVAPRYVENFINQFEKNLDMDVMAGLMD